MPFYSPSMAFSFSRFSFQAIYFPESIIPSALSALHTAKHTAHMPFPCPFSAADGKPLRSSPQWPSSSLEEGHCERARHMNMPCPRHMFSLSPPGICVRALRNLTLPQYLSRPHAQGPSWKTDSRQGRLRNSHLAASSHRVLTRQGYRLFHPSRPPRPSSLEKGTG